ncbi:MAG TPA: TylF/MycF/NovP-related O-methyltransferase [Candidatus Saccharimonadales bacterium]|jgi:O-methyltransferase
MSHTAALLAKYPIISDQITKPALSVLLSQLEAIISKGTHGAAVEFGCYVGTTSLFMRRLLDVYQDERAFHVYDSFAGLPPKTAQDASVAGDDFQAGELTVSKKQFIAEFGKARLRTPIIHKQWFDQLCPADVPDNIAFAFLDGDFYNSIYDSLKLVWPRMTTGSIVCFDDYGREALPGVKRAIHDYFQGNVPAIQISHNIGVILKP